MAAASRVNFHQSCLLPAKDVARMHDGWSVSSLAVPSWPRTLDKVFRLPRLKVRQILISPMIRMMQAWRLTMGDAENDYNGCADLLAWSGPVV